MFCGGNAKGEGQPIEIVFPHSPYKEEAMYLPILVALLVASPAPTPSAQPEEFVPDVAPTPTLAAHPIAKPYKCGDRLGLLRIYSGDVFEIKENCTTHAMTLTHIGVMKAK